MRRLSSGIRTRSVRIRSRVVEWRPVGPVAPPAHFKTVEPLIPTLMVCIVASLGLLFGLFVDVHYYYPEADKGLALIEWLGVTLILGVLFFAPRMRSSGA